MLHFSFSAILMAFLASGIIASLIAVAFLNKNIMVCIGYQFLALFVGLALLRLLFPFEFPFTDTVYLPPLLSRAVSFFQCPLISLGDIQISLWNLFEILWIIGIIINVVYYARNYRLSKTYIQKYGQDKTNDLQYKEALDSICAKHHKPNRFRVIELPQLDTPLLWGIKNPCILLPAGLSIPSDKLHYVLYHEALHCFRHDLIIKSAIHILAILYWWNPACIVLRRQSHTILEMYIDGAISQNNPDIIAEYTECLLYMKKAANTLFPAGARLKEEACPLNSEFKRRTLMLLKQPTVLQKICANMILSLLILSVFAASHLFILEAFYLPPEEGIIPYTDDNTYFIKSRDDSYDLYIDDTYIETVDSLKFYPKGIKIYDTEGVLLNEN